MIDTDDSKTISI